MKSSRTGKDLEKLVAFLEKSLAPNNVLVESPCRLRDKRTGKLREHDVVLTTKVGHHTFRIAIECRDRRRPVGVPQIEAFYQKCVDTDIGRAVIASSGGFHETARKKAMSVGVRCLDLNELSEVDWLALPFLQILHSSLCHIEMAVFVKEEGISGRPAGFVDSAGRPVTQKQLTDFLDRCLRDDIFKQVVGPGRHAIPFEFGLDGIYGLIEGRKEMLQINRVKGTAYYVTEANAEPYQLMSYEDKGDRLAEAAVAELTIGPVRGRLVIALDAKRNVKASFIPGAMKTPNSPLAADGSRRR